MALLESNLYLRQLPHTFGFPDINVIIDSVCKVFLCSGKVEDFENQTCALAFIVEVERERNQKQKQSSQEHNKRSRTGGKAEKYFSPHLSPRFSKEISFVTQ